eukprot:1154925-Pelagomonas_calceolata.AAC.16
MHAAIFGWHRLLFLPAAGGAAAVSSFDFLMAVGKMRINCLEFKPEKNQPAAGGAAASPMGKLRGGAGGWPVEPPFWRTSSAKRGKRVGSSPLASSTCEVMGRK